MGTVLELLSESGKGKFHKLKYVSIKNVLASVAGIVILTIGWAKFEDGPGIGKQPMISIVHVSTINCLYCI